MENENEIDAEIDPEPDDISRIGKIGRLPVAIHEQLNDRLDKGRPGPEILEWLNGLPEVQKLIASKFNNRPVNKQNLSNWRHSGYWQARTRNDILIQAAEVSRCAVEIEDNADEIADELLVDNVATVLAARYAALVAHWDGEVDSKVQKKLQFLGRMCRDVVCLQRSIHRAAVNTFKLDSLRNTAEAEAEAAQRNEFMAPFSAAHRRAVLTQIFGGGKSAEFIAAQMAAIAYGQPIPTQEDFQYSEAAQSSPVKPGQGEKKASQAPDP